MDHRSTSIAFLIGLIALWAWSGFISVVPTGMISANFKNVLGLSAINGVVGSIIAAVIYFRERRLSANSSRLGVARINQFLSGTFVLVHFAVAIYIAIMLASN
jgi:hypothetical protein